MKFTGINSMIIYIDLHPSRNRQGNLMIYSLTEFIDMTTNCTK